MSTDRDRLAAALRKRMPTLINGRVSAELADALLPTVDRIANERAAVELEAAADHGLARTSAREWLRERAAGLREATP